jgi:hypothetical protein
MRRNLVPLVVLGIAVMARPALAQTSGITITPGSDAAAFAQGIGTTPEELVRQITSQVDGLFQVANISSFLRDFQNAQNFSTKGLGVDYASEATLAEVGATFSLATNIDKAYKPSGSYTDPPIKGVGSNISLMAGVGGGLFGFDPLMIFGNWFKKGASLGQFDGNYHNWGLHAQIRLFGPSRKSSAVKMLVRWGGIAVTSGVDYSHIALTARSSLSSRFTLPAAAGIPGGAPITITNSGTLAFTLEQTTWSIPLEVTTSLRLLSLVTVYGGIGLDWQLGGGSDMKLDMRNATLRGEVQTTRFDNLGTADVWATGHVKPSAARVREIVGVQLGILDLIRFFVQVNVTASSPMLVGLAGGLRLAY